VAFFTDVVLNEVDGLVAGGVTQIQIDEPSFAQEPNKLKLVSAYLQKIKDKHPKLKIILALYFYPLTNYWDHLENLPVHGINLDLTLNTQNAWKIISDKKLPFELGLGIINALNTPMENKDTWVQLIKGLISKLSPSTLTLTPNAGLEYLPRQTARQKLTLLAQIKQDLTAPKQTSPLLHAH
jgi:methionine synthase II (cobalamin-independent)